MDYFMDHYIPDRAHYLDWRASPLLAASHANLAAHISFERQIHGFITMGRVIDEANAAVRLCAAELRSALAA